ncbi:MAG: hypothetical protein PVS3B3_08080 [Ktedonobacteraceae bacterium]
MQLEGRQIGRYYLRRLIGHGGVGAVYLAEDRQIARQVALKIVRLEDFNDRDAQDIARLFKREAQAIAMLNHPNILSLFDFGEEMVDGVTVSYLVTQYCPEGSLAMWLRRKEVLHLPHDDAVHIVRQAANALEHAHDNHIIHCDVKPSNFLVRSQKNTPNRPDVLLADFGIARFTHATTSTNKIVRGTSSYMAPEQWDGVCIPASDQYSLAVMAYELLTRRLPFQGTEKQIMFQHLQTQPQPPSAINTRISPAIDSVILRALAKQPEARFPSVSDFAQAFQQVEDDIPTLPSARPFPLYVSAPGDPTLPLIAPDPASTTPAISPHNTEKQTDFRTVADYNSVERLIPSLPPPYKWRKLLLIGLALVVLITSTVSLFASRIHQVTTSATYATSTASQGTIQANESTYSAATASAVAKATATAQVNATATLTENPYDGTMKSLVLNEALNRNSVAQWDETGGSCAFATDGYHVTEQTQTTEPQVCAANHINYGDLTFQVQMNILKGSGGGILFRSAGSVAYYFRISQDRWYTLFACTGVKSACTISLSGAFSSWINSGLHQSNRIAVVAKGSRIGLWINAERIIDVNDSRASFGQIGVVAEANSEVVFSYAKVWTL